jgi:hypothetical protein
VEVKLSDAERDTLIAAAGRAGKALGAYLGEAGLDAAEYRAVPVPKMQLEMLAELIQVRGLVLRIGVNLKRAGARFDATGTPGPDLLPAADYCTRVVRRVDETVTLIRRGLR